MPEQRIAAIIQARMGSIRLPGKSMADVIGKPLLEHVINRVTMASSLDEVVVATTHRDQDLPIIHLAEKCGVKSFAGSEDDVLGRFFEAARRSGVDQIVRICSDNPLIDPYEIDKLVEHHLSTGADYSYNNRPHPKSLPDGSGAEILTMDVLERLHKTVAQMSYREHVTLFIFENPEDFRIEKLDADKELRRPQYSLDVDFQEDLDFIREIYRRLYKPGRSVETPEVIKLLDEHPELLQMRTVRD